MGEFSFALNQSSCVAVLLWVTQKRRDAYVYSKNPDAKTHRIAVGYHINWKEHHSINGILAKICFALCSRIFLNPEGCAMYSSFMIISCTWVMLLRWFVQYCERPLMSHNSAHTRFP